MLYHRFFSSFAAGHFDIAKNALPSVTSASSVPLQRGALSFLFKSFDAEIDSPHSSSNSSGSD